MKLKKYLTIMAIVAALVIGTTGCTGGAKQISNKEDAIVMVWYPNESAKEFEASRREIGEIISKASGLPVEHKLTTDYAVVIESISSGTADLAYVGAQGYIEAEKRNEKVKPLVVNSGPSGTKDDALYYSFLGTKEENKDIFKDGDSYSLNEIEGKRMSFVSNSSTSGFVVPSESIIGCFSEKEQWNDLQPEDLLEGGKEKIFSEVLFGGSHQGSAINIFADKSDVAAFCDLTMDDYSTCVEGNINTAGAVYEINKDAAAPFSKYAGEKYVVIQATPVLNGPIIYNSETLEEEVTTNIRDALTSKETSDNNLIFAPEGEMGIYSKTDKECFIDIESSWFDPIRNLCQK